MLCILRGIINKNYFPLKVLSIKFPLECFLSIIEILSIKFPLKVLSIKFPLKYFFNSPFIKDQMWPIAYWHFQKTKCGS